MVKGKLYRQKSHKEAYTYTLTKEKKEKKKSIYIKKRKKRKRTAKSLTNLPMIINSKY